MHLVRVRKCIECNCLHKYINIRCQSLRVRQGLMQMYLQKKVSIKSFLLQRKGGARGFDMNVEKAWRRGVSGKGISISILDDGLQYRHPDLLQNFVSSLLGYCWISKFPLAAKIFDLFCAITFALSA